MPASLDSSVTGYLTFTAVKFAGYSLFAHGLNRAYAKAQNLWMVGGARTLIGMAVGGAYFGLWQLFDGMGGVGIGYLLGLLPIRIGEWWLIVWFFFDRPLVRPNLGWGLVALRVIWSYICDMPATFGYLITGGLSIC